MAATEPAGLTVAAAGEAGRVAAWTPATDACVFAAGFPGTAAWVPAWLTELVFVTAVSFSASFALSLSLSLLPAKLEYGRVSQAEGLCETLCPFTAGSFSLLSPADL